MKIETETNNFKPVCPKCESKNNHNRGYKINFYQKLPCIDKIKRTYQIKACGDCNHRWIDYEICCTCKIPLEEEKSFVQDPSLIHFHKNGKITLEKKEKYHVCSSCNK